MDKAKLKTMDKLAAKGFDTEKKVEFLEKEGFRCIENRTSSRRDTIDSPFPLIIELDRKSIYHMGSVTSAAAAAGAGVIMSDKDFYLLYSIYSLRKKHRHEEQ